VISPLVDAQSIVDTEAAMLAAACRDTDVRDVALAAVGDDWFMSIEHRKIFGALKKLALRGAAVDMAALMRAAREGRASVADVTVSEDWVFRAIALGRGITAETLKAEHLPMLREAYQLRRIEALGGEISERIPRTENASDLIRWLRERLERIADEKDLDAAVTDAEALSRFTEEARSAREGSTDTAGLGVLTGIRELDQWQIRLAPRQPIVIGARPSHGKTSLSMEIALGAAANGVGGAYFALEDGVAGWQDRRAMMLTGEKAGELRYGRASIRSYRALDSYVSVARERDLPVWVFDNDRSYAPYEIIAMVRRLKRRNPCVGWFIVDQCYDVAGWTQRARGEGRDEAPARITAELIRGARELDVCPVFLQQLNRDADRKKIGEEPTMTDIADSDALAKRARLVMLAWRPNFDDADADDTFALRIVKRTNGRRGRIDLPWDGPRVKVGTFTDPLEVRAIAHGLFEEAGIA